MRIRALDSIRGILLLQMTLDHFGKPISNYLYQCFGFFSAAEGFFFLSGFVGMLAAIGKREKDPSQKWMRSRALKTWRYHLGTLLLLSVLAFWIFPEAFRYFRPLFQHPLEGMLWSITLFHTPEWLDVLPLYVIFLMVGSFFFPRLAQAKKKTQIILLWFPSLALWALSQFGLRDAINSFFPQWIRHGDFDPFAWQCIYFTGAATAAWWKLARMEEASGNFKGVKAINSLTPVFVIAIVCGFLWRHEILPFLQPAEIFISKEHLGILRFANFFAFAIFISWVIRKAPSLLDFSVTNLLGKHSLHVYTAHIFLVYLWFSAPGLLRYQAPWNVLIPLGACVLLWILAKVRSMI